MSKDELVAVVECEIVKPLAEGITWADLGSRLRDVESVAHRLLNDAVTSMAMVDSARRLQWLNEKRAGRGRLNPEGGKGDAHADGNALHSISYKSVVLALDESRDYWREQMPKRAAALARAPKDPQLARDLAMAERRASIRIPGSSLRAYSTLAFQRYSVFRKGALKGATSLPSFKSGAPVLLDGDNVAVRREASGYVLRCDLGAGQWDIAIAPSGGSAHATMTRLVSGEAGWKTCDAKLMRGRGNKWVVKLAYRRPAPTPVTDRSVSMAVHLGVHNALTIACSNGQARVLDTGAKLLHAKAQFRARRASLGGIGKSGTLGAGARGHGVGRRHERLEKLAHAEANYTKTQIQQWAAAVVKWAQRWGAGVILIENYSPRELADDVGESNAHVERLIRSFPLYALREAIRWAATKDGRETVEVPAHYISARCPKCKEIDGEAVREQMFRCRNLLCLLERPVDCVAAWNMLAANGVDAFARAAESEAAFVAAASETPDADTHAIEPREPNDEVQEGEARDADAAVAAAANTDDGKRKRRGVHRDRDGAPAGR